MILDIKKLILKVRFWHFLTTSQWMNQQNTVISFEYSTFCQKTLLFRTQTLARWKDMRHPVPSYSMHAFLISGMSRRWTAIVILCHMYNSSFGYFPKLFDNFWIDTYYLWIDHYGMFLVSFSVQFTNEVQWLISNWKYVLQNTYLSMYSLRQNE